MLGRKGMVAALSAGLVLLWLLACAAPTATPPPATPTPKPKAAWEVEWEKVLANAKVEGKVVLSGPPFVTFGNALTEAFQKRFGITLEYIPEAASSAVVKYEREIAAGKLSADLMVSGPTALVSLVPKGMLEPLPDKFILPEVSDPSKWRGGKLKFMDKEEKYMLETASYVFARITVNTKFFDPAKIRTSKDLLKPELKGKIASHDPRIAGSGDPLASSFLYYLGEDFLRDLYKGQEVVFTRDFQQNVDWVARGTYPVAIGVTYEPLEKYRVEGIPLVLVDLEDVPPALVGGFSVLHMLKGAPHPNAAKVFINWFLTKEGQDIQGKYMLEPSRRLDASNEGVPAYAIPDPSKTYLDQYTYEWFTVQRPRTWEAIKKIRPE